MLASVLGNIVALRLNSLLGHKASIVADELEHEKRCSVKYLEIMNGKIKQEKKDGTQNNR